MVSENISQKITFILWEYGIFNILSDNFKTFFLNYGQPKY